MSYDKNSKNSNSQSNKCDGDGCKIPAGTPKQKNLADGHPDDPTVPNRAHTEMKKN